MNRTKQQILKKIKEYITFIEPEAEVILFGSQARNEERNDSDWDILILVPNKAGLKEEQKFRHKLFELELMFGISLSTFVYSKTEWKRKYQITPFYQNIEKEGMIL